MKSGLKQKLVLFFLSALLAGACREGNAQKMTEIYIPLGQSPGVSGILIVLGRVKTILPRDSTIAIAQEDGSTIIIKVAANTAIYLDKSKFRLTNTKGAFADIKPGLMIEAKYPDDKKGGFIQWVKVQFD